MELLCVNIYIYIDLSSVDRCNTFDTLILLEITSKIMPTTKKRVYITISPDTENILSKLARKDKVPVATKATELLKIGIETLLEDLALAEIADRRSKTKVKYIPYDKVLKKLKY